MPRQSRSRAAPAPRSQTRTASTTAAPPVASHAPPAPVPHPSATAASSGQPGIISQMAATAGSVAAGSVIGHGISSMLFGGSSAPAEQPAAAAQPAQTQAPAAACEIQAKDFTNCVQGATDVQACNWYLEQLKACQAAARPY